MAHHEESKQADVSMKDLAKLMKKIDYCMMTTVDADGTLHSRPMSNNHDVEWDGDTWFFAREDSTQAQEIQRNPQVNLGYAWPRRMVFISVTGKGQIVRDPVKKKELWHEIFRIFLPEGPDSDEVILIRVEGEHATYWGKDGEAHLPLAQRS